MGMEPSAPFAGATLRTNAPALTRLAWKGGLVLVVAYCILIVLLSPLPVQDFPDHLARAVAMNDLLFHGGARFGSIFHFHLEWIPYLLGDLILTVAVAVFGLTGGAAFWILLVFLSLPCAALFYLRVRGIDPAGRSLALLLSVYFATDWFFLMGFLSFRIAVAMLIATLALVELLRRKWSYPLFALYAGAVVLDYLMHLSPIIFLFAALGVTGLLRLWLRTTTLRTEARAVCPGARRAGVALHHRQFTIGSQPIRWRALISGGPCRANSPASAASSSTSCRTWTCCWCCYSRPACSPGPASRAGATCVGRSCWKCWRSRCYLSQRISRYPSATRKLITLTPVPYRSRASFLSRPAWRCRSPDPASQPRREQLAFLLAALLAVGNLAYLARHLIAESAWVAQYRSVVAAIPAHGRVFPVYTHGGDGSVVPFLHVSGYVSMDRAAVEPYVFAGDNGNPMKYFRYLHRPYDPAETWYGEIPRPPIDWLTIARDYDFVVITKPFNPAALAVATRTVAENSSAALLAIQK